MDLLNRYLSAVAKQTPVQERMRIVKITHSLIEAKLAQDNRDLTPDQKLTEVLIELGPPSQVINRFIANPQYLIGPYAHDLYWQILKFIAITIFVSLTIATGVDILLHNPTNLLQMFLAYATNVLGAFAQVFLWITLVFIMFERYGLQIILPGRWHPANLPPASKFGDTIPTFEPMLILFTTAIFFSLCYFTPQLIGAFDISASWQIISVFNLAFFPNFLPFFIILFASSSACQIAKLMSGQWSYPVLMIILLTNFITALTMGLIIFSPKLWNPDFINQFSLTLTSPIALTITWPMIQLGLFVALLLLLGFDSLLQTFRVWQLHRAPTFLLLSELADN